MITHGFSGSGKSTLSQKLAENIGAIQISSDIERKRLFSHQVPKNESVKVGAGLYSHNITYELYLYLAECAKTIIQAGFSVIIDASFLKNDQRNLFRELAVDCNVQFIILDVQASDEELNYRIVHRQNDASEATIEVLNHQLCSAEALTTEELTSVITVDTKAANTFEKLIDQLRK
jgi:predicted kinase